MARRSRPQPQAEPRERAAVEPASDRVPRALSVAVIVVILIAAALIRLRLAGAPLERDEGEYAYAGQLVLQGVPPYQLAYNMKFPGTYYAYSVLLALFGQSPWGIRVGLLVVNAATTLLLYRSRAGGPASAPRSSRRRHSPRCRSTAGSWACSRTRRSS